MVFSLWSIDFINANIVVVVLVVAVIGAGTTGGLSQSWWAENVPTYIQTQSEWKFFMQERVGVPVPVAILCCFR